MSSTKSAPPRDPLAPPPLPIAKRLNRNALIVAAVMMGLTALVAVITMQTSRSDSTDTTIAPPDPNTVTPSFLDVPPAQPTTPANPWMMDMPSDPMEEDPPPMTPDWPMTPDASYHEYRLMEPPSPDPWNAAAVEHPANTWSPTMPSPNPADDSAREHRARYQRALRSPILVAVTLPTTQPVPASIAAAVTSSAPVATPEPPDDPVLAAALAALQAPLPAASAPTPTPSDPLPRMETALRETNVTSLSPPLVTPTAAWNADPIATGMAEQYALRAGTVIPAMLLTAANSQLPGSVLAQVTRNVYDSQTQRVVLIPKGSKLFGRYDSRVATGQQRLLVAWTQVQFPDGQTLTLPDAESVDAVGATGLPGNVDHHEGHLYTKALLLSAVSAGIQLSQPQSGSVYAPPTSRQVAAGAVGQQLGDVTTELIRQQLAVTPTISLPAGTALNVLLQQDVVLPAATVETTGMRETSSTTAIPHVAHHVILPTPPWAQSISADPSIPSTVLPPPIPDTTHDQTPSNESESTSPSPTPSDTSPEPEHKTTQETAPTPPDQAQPPDPSHESASE